ncbi:hypothetical protein ACFLIM_14205 [Nonomuraea sp. M3C6]|uniref:Uncharacterized protein n=1 Tax=Nonomuraea marmarensis TaxID=3351344 RepID=A0ABW7ADD4_9ACTN
MSWRSRLWWAAALALAAAGSAYAFSLRDEAFSFGFFGYGSCPGNSLYLFEGYRIGMVNQYLPLVWFGGAPAVVLAFAAHLLGTRLGRPRAGRVVARVLAVVLLAAHAAAPLAFGVDVAVDRACLQVWREMWFLLTPDVAPTLAALCVLAAVRLPRHHAAR